MRLSWNEIRTRAAAFAREWAGAGYEKGETQSFYNEFFEIFGVRRRTVARYEEHVRRLGDSRGYMDLFWPGVLLVEQKSAGRDLAAAREQADAYFDALPERDRPRYRLVCDFRTFELYDRDERETASFALAELPGHVERFGFILGVQRRAFVEQAPVNVEASGLMGALHDALKASGYAGCRLELFLVRTVFCLFADDTGIFEPRDIFLQFLEDRTRDDGSDMGPWLERLFQVLNTPIGKRQKTLDEDLARFPYVNGDLFAETLPIADFDSGMRDCLLDACRFDWSAISPAIFGALFQSVMEPAERRRQGAHYTAEKNILKVIEPLFLDDLRSEFARLKARPGPRRLSGLRRFHARLARLRFLDPACGCGNFLIVAYRELRALEIELLRELREAAGGEGQREIASILSAIDVDRFHGIEIDEFPARIAETAMWMMDHIMNNRLSLEFGETYVRIPLEKSPHIVHADALEIDWADVLPPGECDYVMGNPPFSGFVMRDKRKQAQAGALLKALGAGGSRLDYVAAWFLKAGAYLQGRRARIGFVATNSIVQGEQVAQLWPALFDRYNLDIMFGHTAFRWDSDARGAAHVHVVIAGLCDRETAPPDRRLFVYPPKGSKPAEMRVSRIGPYLVDASTLADPRLVVKRHRYPLSARPGICVGTKPVDQGHYILDSTRRQEILRSEPNAAKLIYPFIGGKEYIRGGERWILAPSKASPSDLRDMPIVRSLIRAVRNYREKGGELAKSLADSPAEFHVTVIPSKEFLVIPEVSTERREYVPIGYLKPPAIPSNKLWVVENATPQLFALIASAMHMAWLSYVGGRLGNEYSYSGGLVYNSFPLPRVPEEKFESLDPHANAVLAARAAHPDSTLADLYDPDLMPSGLRKAHRALDRAVDRLYRPGGFASERERAEHLCALYEKAVAPVTASPKRRGRGGARRAP